MRARLRLLRPRRLALVLPGAVALLLLAGPAAHADIWANVGPASSLGGSASRWPLGNYALDEHFSAISAGVFSGVDVSGLLPMVAFFFANELWQLTAWLANTLVGLFGLAFSLDLVNGSSATNGAGALGPVSRAIQSIYSDVLGGPWMVVGVSVAGMWAMWRALVQRRYAETAGQLALSLLYVGIAFLFVLQPGRTIGAASHWTDAMSGAFLSIARDGEPTSQGEAREAGADQLFGLLVARPWAVLEFGGLDHCVKAGGGEEPESVAVQPLPDGAARRLESGETVSTGGKTCIDNLRRYGPHFLRFAPGSDERDDEFDALESGDSAKLPDADPGKRDGSYRLGPADEPAAAAMGKGGQYQRLLVAIVVFVAELGAFFLLGALSVGVITAQVLLLLLLAFSPVALVAAGIPGRGHQFFRGWLAKLAGFLLRKAAYSLVLAVLLAVCAAISAATSELGWLFSFGLQCAFFWAVFLQRKSLTDGLVGAVTGPRVPGRGRALDAVALYMGARTGTRLAARPLRAARSRLGGRGGAPPATGPERVAAPPGDEGAGPPAAGPAGRGRDRGEETHAAVAPSPGGRKERGTSPGAPSGEGPARPAPERRGGRTAVDRGDAGTDTVPVDDRAPRRRAPGAGGVGQDRSRPSGREATVPAERAGRQAEAGPAQRRRRASRPDGASAGRPGPEVRAGEQKPKRDGAAAPPPPRPATGRTDDGGLADELRADEERRGRSRGPGRPEGDPKPDAGKSMSPAQALPSPRPPHGRPRPPRGEGER